jgi:hypothetical protein
VECVEENRKDEERRARYLYIELKADGEKHIRRWRTKIGRAMHRGNNSKRHIRGKNGIGEQG